MAESKGGGLDIYGSCKQEVRGRPVLVGKARMVAGEETRAGEYSAATGICA